MCPAPVRSRVFAALLALLAGFRAGPPAAGAGMETQSDPAPLLSTTEVAPFLAALAADLPEGSPRQLASYAPGARRALQWLRDEAHGDSLADWLAPRLDLLEAEARFPARRARRLRPAEFRPQYARAYWDRVLAHRPAPRRAAELVPQLKEIFRSAGVPPEWVWIAEVESAMNPEATSPAGARGLFQFMPATAARFGLDSEAPFDERTDPFASARAAAAYLRILHRQFHTWPLALAAYNAGEGRVGRALAARQVRTFDLVSPDLPAETRMYVPKVLAVVGLRESVDPEHLPAPQAVVPAPEIETTAALPPAGLDGNEPGESPP